MLRRSLVVWFGLLVLAIANAGVREALITPSMGASAGRVISTITLCAAILVLSWLTIGWIRPRSSRDAWAIGGLWFGLTVAFEFLGGHYLFGNPWSRLLEDYNVFRGRVWVLVLLTTALAPLLCARARGLIPPQHETGRPHQD
jgi:hypothetical protein